MDNVNKTLYIPLYGKAFVSQKGIILRDTMAEQIWSAVGFPLKAKSRSKWLAYYMGMRAAVFDEWLREKMSLNNNAIVIHIGCGLDSRIERVGHGSNMWYDIDFPEVISERKKFFKETESYRMLSTDVSKDGWTNALQDSASAIVVMEGVSMYLSFEDLCHLFKDLQQKYGELNILADFYTTFAAKASKYKNPINDVGVTTVYGLNDPMLLSDETGLSFVEEHSMTPIRLIDQLKSFEKSIFKRFFAGKLSEKMYRLYEYKSK